MNAGRRDKGQDRPEPDGNEENFVSTSAATATVQETLYVDFAKWLDRDLARLETLYKDWATAGYGQWRRSLFGQR